MSVIFMKFFSKVLGFGCGLLLPFSLQTYGSVLASSDIGRGLASQSPQEALQKQPIGIQNQGATCYANAVIQALLSFDFLRESLSCALFLNPSVKNLSVENRTPEQIRGDSLCAYLTDVMGAEFTPGQQQDAHGFMLGFFEGVRRSSGKNDLNRFLSDLFGLLQFNKYTVNFIDGVSDRNSGDDPSFSFQIQADERIQEALAKLNSDVVSIRNEDRGLDNSNYPYIKDLNETFIVQAKVFGLDEHSRSIKLKRDVEPEPNLIIPELVGNGFQRRFFALNAMVLHNGDINGGHYIALVRYGEDWYLVNDSLVQNVGALPRSVKGFTPYLYFYQEGEYPDGIQLKGDLASLSDAAGGSNCNYLKSRSSKDAVFSGLKMSPSTMSVTSQGPGSGSFQQSGKNFSVPYQVMELLMSQKRK